MKKNILFTVLILFCFNLSAEGGKGPLWGKNYYVPFLPFYSFPGVKAGSGNAYDLNITFSQYYIQDIVTEFHLSGSELIKERFIDYEGYILEPTVSFNPADTVEVGLTTRLHTYYGGIFDPVFESFHGLFEFPNGGRDSYPLNDVYINIHTDSGLDLNLTEPDAAMGDTDLFCKWTVFSRRFIDLAIFSALKIPTGTMESVSGSGYMDLSFALLSDFNITGWFSLYIQNGIILPGQLFLKDVPSPEPMYSLLTSFEFIISPKISLVAQFRLMSSPIKEGSVIPDNISYSVKLHRLLTNIMAGVVMDLSGYRLQVSIEEDAFTNNGADLIFNVTVSKSFNLAK